MPKDRGHSKGRAQSSTMVVNPKPRNKTAVKRRGKRGK